MAAAVRRVLGLGTNATQELGYDLATRSWTRGSPRPKGEWLPPAGQQSVSWRRGEPRSWLTHVGGPWLGATCFPPPPRSGSNLSIFVDIEKGGEKEKGRMVR